MRAMLSKIIGSEFPITSVMEVNINDWRDYGQLLGCDIFTVVTVEYKDETLSIFVDDEGLLKSNNFGRMVEGYPQPLFGNIIVTGGTDDEGNTLPLPDTLSIMDMEGLIGGIKYQTR